MQGLGQLVFYLIVGLVGGFCGYKLKIPAGSLVGAMVFVIIAKLLLKSEWQMPRYFGFGLQVLIGVLVGSQFQPSLLQTFHRLIIPVMISCVVLVLTGILMSIIFYKIGLLDIGTGYLGTSPGAMTVLIVLALDSHVNTAVITSFHLFRVIFVILTAPLILKLIQMLN